MKKILLIACVLCCFVACQNDTKTAQPTNNQSEKAATQKSKAPSVRSNETPKAATRVQRAGETTAEKKRGLQLKTQKGAGIKELKGRADGKPTFGKTRQIESDKGNVKTLKVLPGKK